MTFDPARPKYMLPFAGQEYELVGTLGLIEAVEFAFQEGIVRIAARTPDMGLTETAKLTAAVLGASGHKLTAAKVGEALFDAGVNSEAFMLLRLHLYAFLKIVMQPPELREGTAKQMGELLGKAGQPSRGKSTRKSPSAS